MFNQKFIIISLTFFILASFSFLAISEKRQHAIEDGWFLYFNNIQDNSLNFTIENYSDKNNFTWEISTAGQSPIKGDTAILKGNKENVIINNPFKKGQAKITVYHAKETKEIYKNFE